MIFKGGGVGGGGDERYLCVSYVFYMVYYFNTMKIKLIIF